MTPQPSMDTVKQAPQGANESRKRSQRLGMRLRVALIVMALLATAGGALILRAPTAHASLTNPGSCTYYRIHNEGYWHTNLCVQGPYYGSNGKYYTFTASCWVTSAYWTVQKYGYPNFDFGYELGCTVEDNAVMYNWKSVWKSYPPIESYNSEVALSMTFNYSAPAGRTVMISTNYLSWIEVMDDARDTISPNPGDRTLTQQYLP